MHKEHEQLLLNKKYCQGMGMPLLDKGHDKRR